MIHFDAGNSHSLAVLTNGTVVGWGLNHAGQAVAPLTLTNAVAVAAGSGHSLALRADGKVTAWGESSASQTNVPVNLSNVAAIAAGEFHNLVLLTNGRVFAWGGNASGQSAVPVQLTSGEWLAGGIAAGANHSLAVRRLNNRGTVVCLGNNLSGQANPPTDLVNGNVNVAAVAAGDVHSLALLANGTVRGWGANGQGQAVPPAGLSGIRAIAAGGNDSMALRSNGTVVVWGANANATGMGLPPAGLTNVVAITVANLHKMALVARPIVITTSPTNQSVRTGETVVFSVAAQGVEPLSYQWQRNGTNLFGRTFASLTLDNVQLSDVATYTVLIAGANGAMNSASATLTVSSPPFVIQPPASASLMAGESVTLQVVAGGSGSLRYRWRKNGQVIGPAINSTYSIFGAQPGDAGNYDVVITNNFGAVTSAVAVVTVGQPPVITQQPQSQSALAGSSVTFEVGASFAQTYQWRKDGGELPGQTSPTLSISGVQAGDAGGYSVRIGNAVSSVDSATAVLTVTQPGGGSGTNVVVWGQLLVFVGGGYIDMHAPAGLDNAIALAAGFAHNLALRDDTTVTGWGDNSLGQSASPSLLSNVTAIAAGAQHSLARRNDGTVVAWGSDTFGQSTPPPGLGGITAIAAGANHSLALRSDGSVAGWGANTFGQATPPPNTPALTALAAGGDFSLGLKADRTVAGWGENEYGQTHAPAGLMNVVALAAGQSHSLALRNDGTVVAWGRNHHGQTNVPAGLSGVAAIAAGANHSLARQSNGTVVVWGQNNEGQVDVPARLVAGAIAASGSRSLAVRLKQFRIVSITPRVSGGWQLGIGHSDGSTVTSQQLNNIEVRTTTDITQPVINWTRLTSSLSLQNGVARIDDPRSDLVQRFYLVIER